MEDMQTDPLFNFDNIISDLDEQKGLNENDLSEDKNGLFKGFDESSEVLDEANCDLNSEASSVSINSEAWKESDNEEDNVENTILENGISTTTNGLDSIETNQINNKDMSDKIVEDSSEKQNKEMDYYSESDSDNKIQNISDSTSENQQQETDDISINNNVEKEKIQDNNTNEDTESENNSENNSSKELSNEKDADKEDEDVSSLNSTTEGDKNTEIEDKETLDKENEENNVKNTNGNEDMSVDNVTSNNDCEGMEEEGDDLDPLLLCPEVSMAIDEAPVITNSNIVPTDGTGSPLPYAPVFSTYVDEMTGAEVSFNLTVDEENLRHKTFGPGAQPIQFTKIHCTACNVHLGSALEAQKNRYVHPLLKVLICKECYHFYTSGDFEKDEDGSELYCRWCGQGGQVICCSKCEYVFCKKCIRINVGRRKLNKIKGSDEWDCFRCDQPQISHVRTACVELFQYVQQEMSRASMMEDPSILSIDHTTCCKPPEQIKRNLTDIDYDFENKKKKRKVQIDPDYDPLMEKEEELMYRNDMSPLQSNNINGNGAGNLLKIPTVAARKEMILNNNHIKANYIFKPMPSNDNDVEFIGSVPASTLIPGTVPVPMTFNSNLGVPSSNVRFARLPPLLPSTSRPMLPNPNLYRMGPPTLHRFNTPNLITNNNFTRPLQPNILKSHLTNNVRNEWFQKTVRAASRVNSNLSYTLTQLDRDQSRAQSIEELAVVHNKLQEILSSTINSLIQVRKNLRTEFIAGIKTVRFPSNKPTTTTTQTNDDDVIFVTTPSLVSIQNKINIPVPIMTTATNNRNIIKPSTSKSIQQNPIYVINPTANAFNSNFKSGQNIPLMNVVAGSSNKVIKKTFNSSDKSKKTYLKVKTVSELQNLSSDCITIPDEDPLKDTEVNNDEINKSNKNNSTSLVSSTKKFHYNMNDTPSLEIKRMLTVKVKLERLDITDKLNSMRKNTKI